MSLFILPPAPHNTLWKSMWAGSMVLAAKPKILGTMVNQNGRESTLLSCARASICVAWHTCAIHTTYILLSKSKGSLAPTHSPKPKYLQCNKCIFEEQWITWKFLRNNYEESTTKLNNYFHVSQLHLSDSIVCPYLDANRSFSTSLQGYVCAKPALCCCQVSKTLSSQNAELYFTQELPSLIKISFVQKNKVHYLINFSCSPQRKSSLLAARTAPYSECLLDGISCLHSW